MAGSTGSPVFLVEHFPQMKLCSFFQKNVLTGGLWYNSLSYIYENLLTNKNL